MSSEVAASCCCEPQTGRLWYALKCADYFDNYCCDPGCDNAADRIEFCESYLISIGVPIPPAPGTCYYIVYDCCMYILEGFVVSACPPPVSLWPLNVGRLFLVKPHASSGPACCYPAPATQGDVGGIGNLEVDGQPAISNNPEYPCEETVAECYDFYDQAGTVRGKEPTVKSSITVCIVADGVPHSVRCNHGPPITYKPLTKSIEQKIGTCYPSEPLSTCPGERRQNFVEFLQCPECITSEDCCGQPSPCDSDPNYCDSTYDKEETYSVRTCYSLTNCNDDHSEDILELFFDRCFASNRGVNFSAPDLQAQLEALFLGSTGIVQVIDKTVFTGWGPFVVPAIVVCGLTVNMFSGNAAHAAMRINNRLGALVQASGIGPWSAFFWFGFRQSCVLCPGQGPNERPGASFGDTIYVDRVEWNPATQQIRVVLKAVSPRWYACAAQTMTSDWSADGNGVTNTAISATGNSVPYTLQ